MPVYDTIVQIVDDEGNDLPVGEMGELVTTGPQVVVGYWNKAEETAKALAGGSLHTGDVGYMDDEGCFYAVNRKKDQINAGGYKVWPARSRTCSTNTTPSARPPWSGFRTSTAASRQTSTGLRERRNAEPRQGKASVREFFAMLATFEVHDFQVLDLLASNDQVVA